MPTISEIALAAGVSPATVSRTFASPDRLTKETRERVLAVADRLNYRPRRSAVARPTPVDEFIGFQFFASSATDTILANDFYAGVLAGAQAEAAAQGLHLVLHTTYPGQLTRELPKMVQDRAVAGMLLVGIEADDAEVIDRFSEYIPQIVLVDNHDPTGRHDCVLSDGASGGYTATSRLLDLGHRRIGFLMSGARVKTFQDRLQGFFGAHYAAGISVDPSLIVTTDGLEDISRHLAPYLQSPGRPTALLASNDLAASAVMRICRDLGIGIPEDLSLIGFDDLSFSSHTYPTLSTVRVDKEALGRMAVRRLRERLLADPAPGDLPALSLVLPVSLILRQSTCALQHLRG